MGLCRAPAPARLACSSCSSPALGRSPYRCAPNRHRRATNVPASAPVGKAKPKEVPLIERLRSPYEADRPVAEKLRFAAQALETLYFAVLVYDIFPEMIADAVACLDLDEVRPAPRSRGRGDAGPGPGEHSRQPALPLSSVPDEAACDTVVLRDAGPATLSMRRGPDGGWRFDETLGRLPALRLAAAGASRPPARRRSPGLPARGPHRPVRTMPGISFPTWPTATSTRRPEPSTLSTLSAEQRRQQGPALAQQLAFVLQRRGFMFREEIPDRPDGPPGHPGAATSTAASRWTAFARRTARTPGCSPG